MGKRKYYSIIDTETATLPFVNEWELTAQEKQKISIAKPLVYDIGYTVINTQGEILKRVNYLVQEIFFVPSVFNTAYYKEKRPIYIDLLNKGLIEVKPWEEIVNLLISDLMTTNLTGAFNACFDFKKAIRFTDEYINALYSDRYYEWEKDQKIQCEYLLKNGKKKKEETNSEFLEPIFKLRGLGFGIVDIWSLACQRLINTARYKNYCLDNGFVTDSGLHFKTSAEIVYRYLTNNNNFNEQHTALNDAEIESFILAKALKKGKIEPSIIPFPFREIGTTYDYALKNKKYLPIVHDLINNKVQSMEGYSSYKTRLNNILNSLEVAMDE